MLACRGDLVAMQSSLRYSMLRPNHAGGLLTSGNWGPGKNSNNNPIVERAVQKLRIGLQKREPEGSSVSPSTLVLATAITNSRVRHHGLTACVVLFQSDQFTGQQLPFSGDVPVSKTA